MTIYTQAKAVSAVMHACACLERSEYTTPGDSYDRLSTGANMTDTAGRIEIAAAAYLHGTRQLRGSRAFDNCFENGDGDAVVAELTRRADRDQWLMRAIVSDFGGTFPASWRAACEAAGRQMELAL
jgi:hypothetical protein